MNCNYNQDGECVYPIAMSCKDKCPYRDLLEDYTELKQTYDACYNEHMRIVQQNKQLQAEVKDLEDLAQYKETCIRELQAKYNQLLEETKLTD